jgi:DUF1680 family protein
VRGCVALERGPLVYCIEGADLAPATELEAIEVGPGLEPRPVPRPDVAPELVGLSLPAAQRGRPSEPIEIDAIPYFAWANRAVGPMRVWIPRRST